MRGWERLASWVAAGQLAVIAEFARRRPRDYVERGADGPGGHADRGDPRVPQVSEYAVDEVAAALRLSRPAAGARLQLAVELAGRLPGTAAALAAGVIDVPKTRAVVEAVTRSTTGSPPRSKRGCCPPPAGAPSGSCARCWPRRCCRLTRPPPRTGTPGRRRGGR